MVYAAPLDGKYHLRRRYLCCGAGSMADDITSFVYVSCDEVIAATRLRRGVERRCRPRGRAFT